MWKNNKLGLLHTANEQSCNYLHCSYLQDHAGTSTNFGEYFNVTPSETNIPARVELYGVRIHDGVKLRFCIVPT